MRLLRAEWSRLFARRFTRLSLLLLVSVLALIAAGTAASSHKISDADHRRAEVLAAEMRAECERHMRSVPNAPPLEEACPPIDPREMVERPFTFRIDMPDYLIVFGALLALVAFLVGASFVGAEWTSGGIVNLLLWQPRRVPVLVGKLTALLTGVAGVGAVLAGAWYGGFWLIARARGDLGGVTGGVQASLMLTGVRTMALAMAAAVLGFTLATLGRRTAAALGVVVAYTVLVEIGGRIVTGLMGVRNPELYALSTYVYGWLNGKYRYFDYSACEGSFFEGCEKAHTIALGPLAALLGGIAAVLLASALAMFQRRDVT